MMQEVNVDADHVTQALAQTAIADQLQDAAQTAVTQAATTPPASVSVVPPPSELPSHLASPPMMTSPPPPTGGFVPSPGSVTGTPGKYPAVAQSLANVSPMASPSYTSGVQVTGTTPPPVYNPGVQMTGASPPPVYNPNSSATASPTPAYNPGMSPPSSASPPPPQSTHSFPSQTSIPPPQPAYQATPAYSSIQPPLGGMAGPHDAGSAAVDLGGDTLGPTYAAEAGEYRQQGFMGWFSGAGFMNKVMEKTKTFSENLVTTLDPGMKEVIHSGGDIDIVVASVKEVKVGAVRQAFQEVFGRATVNGQESQPSIAPQPVGYTAGLKGCEERLEQLRRGGRVHERQALVAVENFIVEVLPDKWFDIGCILLKDPTNNIELQTFTQATPLSSEWVQQAQDQTPADYDRRWSGLAVTVGQVIARAVPHVDHADWHRHFTGVSRREMLYLAGKTLAGMYKQQLPAPRM